MHPHDTAYYSLLYKQVKHNIIQVVKSALKKYGETSRPEK